MRLFVFLQRRGVHRLVNRIDEPEARYDLSNLLLDLIPPVSAAVSDRMHECLLRDLVRIARELVEVHHGVVEPLSDPHIHEVFLDAPHR